jgi:hypothetical protein
VSSEEAEEPGAMRNLRSQSLEEAEELGVSSLDPKVGSEGTKFRQ